MGENLLPMDLVMDDILPRLPSKSLMRFKCVSKLWSSHITTRYFTHRFLTVPCRPRPRFYMCLTDINNSHEYLSLSFAPDTTTTTTTSFVVAQGLTIPRTAYMVQTFGGFMCVTVGTLQIFNPATRQLVTLPAVNPRYPPPGQRQVKKTVSCFFGHDPVNDQYKMLCSTSVHSNRLRVIMSEHWVFVLKPGGGSWKRVAPDICPHIPRKKGVCIDGVIYYRGWITYHTYVIVSFHLRSEEFETIKTPWNVRSRQQKHNLIDYGGKLTILIENLGDMGMLDLWVLEDAKNQEWSRKTLDLQLSMLRLVNDTTFYVSGTTQNGNLLLIPSYFVSPFYVLCYDLQNKDMRKIKIKGVPDYWFRKGEGRVLFDVMFMDQSESIVHLET